MNIFPSPKALVFYLGSVAAVTMGSMSSSGPPLSTGAHLAMLLTDPTFWRTAGLAFFVAWMVNPYSYAGVLIDKLASQGVKPSARGTPPDTRS